MAASSNVKRNYHVFLSFRGTDVRQGFLSHLYAAMKDEGIYTFVDSEELRKGEEISPALMRAIEESHFAIIVFSENYASSRWCLEELLKIMECKEKDGLEVFPVFYKVKPREVREGRDSYKRAMDNHESKLGKDSEKVKNWKKALFKAGSLSGSELNDRVEAELVESIVAELSSRVRPRLLDVAKYPVDIEPRVQKLISLSKSAGSDVLMIGLWGPGGIGKTTIAKALYNPIKMQFQGCSFLEQVREKSNQTGGLVALQKQLLSQILSHNELTVHGVSEGVSLIRERLRGKKVLLVLDDVDQMDQLKALAREGNWFGEGSRIIVTSRDKHLLTSHGIKCVYEVEALKKDEALDLFSRYAFPNSNSVEIGMDLIQKTLQYANGLPLALEVLGSFLHGRNEAAWESALHKLSKSPDQTINGVLKTSFDGLEKNEREIFLDIACFLKGKGIGYIKEVLDASGFETTIGIDILIERSLIKNENGILQMHDLIQLMGKDIVNQEGPNDPRKRSRLWLFEDVEDIFCYNTGTDAVKAIVLDLRPPEAIVVDLPPPEEISISPDAFTNMKKLRMLILLGVHISSQGQVRLPNELRWLEWPNAPNLEFGSGRNKLMTLDVPKSHIRQLGGSFHNFGKLKSINFSKCKSLVSICDLSSAPNMEKLILDQCKSLVEVHPSVGNLVKLEVLSLKSCSNVSNFPNTLRNESLEILHLSGCSKLEKFPDTDRKMEHLKQAYLERTAIRELPASIQNFVSMSELNLAFCKDLVKLPPDIYKLKNLKYLNLFYCSNLITFPKNMEDSIDHNGLLGFQKLSYLGLEHCNLSEIEFLESTSSFPALQVLHLSYNKFTHLPTSINEYYTLEQLKVEGCELLQEIPQLPPNINHLSATNCKSLQKLPDLLWDSGDLTSFLLFREGDRMDDVADVSLLEMRWLDVVISGREMPKWIQPCEEDSRKIFFEIPQDLYDEIKGLAICVVLSPEEGKVVDVICDIRILNGQEAISWDKDLMSIESDHVWLRYDHFGNFFPDLREDFLQNDRSQFQVCFKAKRGSIKKCGFRLICEQKEDDLRVVFPVPLADRSNVEVFWGDSEEDNSIEPEEETPIETDAEESSSP